MLIVGVFAHCTELELALSLLEHNGIKQSWIMVVPMDRSQDAKSTFSPRIASDAEMAFEIGMAGGTAFSVVGVSLGFSLYLGPLLWGVIFAVIGFLLAFGITLLVKRKKSARFGSKYVRNKNKKANQPEITVLIQCEKERAGKVSQILWEHEAIAVGELAYE
ncbi:hypothetical protein [Paenibacillus harenae]|uniref:hypothetical protein n=1 Tax=Paenibacillus harenae TaxID=306543 RepID=UPI00041953E0|nr:hypothetical protein [Paenibacillus harenae]